MSFMSFTSSGVFDDADAVNLSSFDFCEIKAKFKNLLHLKEVLYMVVMRKHNEFLTLIMSVP